MSYLITNTVKGFTYWASIFYYEGDSERWGVEWQGVRQNGQIFTDREHAEGWLKEIEAIQGHLNLKIVEA